MCVSVYVCTHLYTFICFNVLVSFDSSGLIQFLCIHFALTAEMPAGTVCVSSSSAGGCLYYKACLLRDTLHLARAALLVCTKLAESRGTSSLAVPYCL